MRRKAAIAAVAATFATSDPDPSPAARSLPSRVRPPAAATTTRFLPARASPRRAPRRRRRSACGRRPRVPDCVASPTLAVTVIDALARRRARPASVSIRSRMRSASSSAPSCVGLRQRDDELLTAVARRLVDAARLLAQDPADRPQHGVALRMAVGVVDRLEVVEVEDQQREVEAEARAREPPRGRSARGRRGCWRGR